MNVVINNCCNIEPVGTPLRFGAPDIFIRPPRGGGGHVRRHGELADLFVELTFSCVFT